MDVRKQKQKTKFQKKKHNRKKTKYGNSQLNSYVGSGSCCDALRALASAAAAFILSAAAIAFSLISNLIGALHTYC